MVILGCAGVREMTWRGPLVDRGTFNKPSAGVRETSSRSGVVIGFNIFNNGPHTHTHTHTTLFYVGGRSGERGGDELGRQKEKSEALISIQGGHETGSLSCQSPQSCDPSDLHES